MTIATAPAHVLGSLAEEDAVLLARFEDDYAAHKSRRRCSRRDFMDGYLAAARRFAKPLRPSVSRTERQRVARHLAVIS